MLGAKIESLNLMEGQFSLYSDVHFTRPFVFENARHGDIIYLQGTTTDSAPTLGAVPTSTPPVSTEPKPKPPAGEKESETEEGEKDDKWRPPCRHGPRGMCESCMPREDAKSRYQKELAKWKGRGMSVAVMEALEALKFKITPQEDAHITAAAVDNDAAREFQAYIAATHFGQQRVGICYGDVQDGETRVLAIYEPPQIGGEDVYRLQEGEDGGDMTERADAVAKMLGLQRVGIVFSAKPRKCILSGLDVVFAAKMAAALSEEERKAFAVMVVSVAETGETLFEAYQISDLAYEMYKADLFEDESKQKPNSGRVICKEDVLVEGKDTRKVHTEFFLLNVPIKRCESWLRTKFAVENRPIAPQGPADLKKAISDNSVPYQKRLSDFHVLLFLSNIFDINSDMPSLTAAVKQNEDIGEGFRLMIEGMASSS